MPSSAPDLNLHLATRSDITTIFQIRSSAILALAPDRMTIVDATSWANRPDHPEHWQIAIEKKKLWLAYESDQPVAWFSVTDDFVDGLYVIQGRQHSGVAQLFSGWPRSLSRTAATRQPG